MSRVSESHPGNIAAVYARVSTRSQEENHSIIRQRTMLSKMATEGLEVRLYDEGVASSVDFNREEFQRLQRDIDSGEVAEVIVEDISRLARENWIMTALVSLMQKHNIIIKSDKGIYDPSKNLADLLMLMIESNQHSEARKDTRRRTSKGRYDAFAGMTFLYGRAVSYGYKTEPVQIRSNKMVFKHVINEPEAEIVREIFNRYINEGNMFRIAVDLNERNIPRHAMYADRKQNRERGADIRWTANIIGMLMKNPVYKGIVTYNKHGESPVTGDWEPVVHHFKDLEIVSPAAWETAQEVRKGRRKLTPRAINPGRGEMYALSGVLRCPHCGDMLDHAVSPESNAFGGRWRCRNHGDRRQSLCETGFTIRDSIAQDLIWPMTVWYIKMFYREMVENQLRDSDRNLYLEAIKLELDKRALRLANLAKLLMEDPNKFLRQRMTEENAEYEKVESQYNKAIAERERNVALSAQMKRFNSLTQKDFRTLSNVVQNDLLKSLYDGGITLSIYRRRRPGTNDFHTYGTESFISSGRRFGYGYPRQAWLDTMPDTLDWPDDETKTMWLELLDDFYPNSPGFFWPDDEWEEEAHTDGMNESIRKVLPNVVRKTLASKETAMSKVEGESLLTWMYPPSSICSSKPSRGTRRMEG